MFVITSDWLKKSTQGPFSSYLQMHSQVLTRDQANVLGEGWPLISGWFERAIGKQLTEDQRIRFEARLKKKDVRRLAKV